MSADLSRQYQTQQIMTASPAMLVFMLYDKAVGCLKEAIRAIEAGDIEARWRANGRAMEIVEHLRATLNMDAGGEIAQNLDRLYGLVLRELPKVDLKNDPAPAQETIKLLEPLRQSWKALADKGDDATRQAAQAAAQTKMAGAAAQAKPGQAPAAAKAAPAKPATATGAPQRITLSA